MLKRVCLFLIMLLPVIALAQDVENEKPQRRTNIVKPSRDFLMLQFTYEGWNNKPDSIRTTGIGRGFNAYLCYDFPFKTSNFSFAAGIGIGTSNIYFDNQHVLLNSATDSVAVFANEDPNNKYKKSKLTTAYLEAPFELRFFSNRMNRNKGFKAAAGFRVGTLVGAHTKLKLDNDVVEKVNTKNYLENWRFAVTGRVGWGNFAVMGSYNLNTLFEEGKGPSVSPFSLGLSITGL